MNTPSTIGGEQIAADFAEMQAAAIAIETYAQRVANSESTYSTS